MPIPTRAATITEPVEPQSGVCVIDKPAGWTSHQVVGRVRRIVGTRRVGHAGTLDPMATGVLVVGVGRATRLLGRLALTAKAYTATIRLGIATLTDDADGAAIETPGAAEVTEEQLRALLPQFRGDLMQVPSSVSAIKVGGVRSYARVRAGADVTLAARPVRVDRFDCLAVRAGMAGEIPVLDCDVEVECSSGTYIRALARDVGRALGCGGHLTALRRTRVGPFGVTQAQTLDEAAGALRLVGLGEVARACFATSTVDEAIAARVRHGQPLAGVALAGEPTALLDPAGNLLALYRRQGRDSVAEAVFVG